MIDYYKLLNISKTAGEEEIKEAHKNQLRLWRTRDNSPDMNIRQEAEQILKQLEEAKKILLNASQRSQYDRQLEAYVETPEPTQNVNQGNSIQDLVKEGWRLLANGDIASALYVATQARNVDSKSPQAWVLLAQAKFRWGDIEDAIYEYKSAINISPNQAAYYFDLGCVYQTVKRWDEALQQFQRASQIEPKLGMYRVAIAGIYISQEKYHKGIDILERCVQEEPNNTNYQKLLASAYRQISDKNWALHQGEYYATKKQHIIEALSYIKKAENLKFDDADLTSQLQVDRRNIEANFKRKFVGNKTVMILGGFAWSLIVPLSGLILAPLYYFSCRVPQYAINNKVLAGERDYIGAAMGSGCMGIIIVLAILPFTVFINFIRNYTGENAT